MIKRTVIDSSLLERSMDSIAQGSLTNSKHPNCLIRGAYPTHIKRGDGAILFDSLNNEYYDYICGLGTNLLGYANIELTRVIHDEICKGVSYSLSSCLEVEAAERLKGMVPFLEKVKFLKTGSEACHAALRISRAYTGRTYVLSDGYHGWGEEFTSLTPPSLGVTSQPFITHFNSIDQINDSIAAVIIEPIQLDASIDRIRYLNKIREKCTQTGTVLIFDEIITGLRFKNYCVSNCYSINPDLLLLGKSLAGGLPLAVVGGNSDLMDIPQYFVSGTYSGENASLRAMIKTIDLLWSQTYKLKDLWGYGQDFIDFFNGLWPEKIWLDGYSVRARFNGDRNIINLFWQEAAQAGILFGSNWFYCFSHFEYQYSVMSIITDIINQMKSGNCKLWGQAPISPFSQKARM